MVESLDFGDAASDVEFVARATKLHQCLVRLEEHVDIMALSTFNTRGDQPRPQPTLELKVDRELADLFVVNTLFWMKVKLQGQDPSTHPVKGHLAHVRRLMENKKQIIDRRTRPTLNKQVAARFIRNGLWQPKPTDNHPPPNKITKFAD